MLLHAYAPNGPPAGGWGKGIRFPTGLWGGVGSAPAEDMPPGVPPLDCGVRAYPPPTALWGRELLRMPPRPRPHQTPKAELRVERIMGSLLDEGSMDPQGDIYVHVQWACNAGSGGRPGGRLPLLCGKEAASAARLQPLQTTEAELRAEGSWARWGRLEGPSGRVQHGPAEGPLCMRAGGMRRRRRGEVRPTPVRVPGCRGASAACKRRKPKLRCMAYRPKSRRACLPSTAHALRSEPRYSVPACKSSRSLTAVAPKPTPRS